MATTQQGSLPMINSTFDVIAVLHRKTKALQTYEQYLRDVQHDTRLRQTFVEMRNDEYRHVETLMNHLGRLLNESLKERTGP